MITEGTTGGTTGGAPAATVSQSAARSAATGAAQSPGAVCRNSRAVGYHGLSERSLNQRQSGLNGSSTHTGRASAPARCATAVSTVTTRSRLATAAAVSEKSVSSGARSTRLPAARAAGSPADLQREPAHAGHREKRRQRLEPDRAIGIVAVGRVAGPDEADLEA